jgi:hypothetical protein
MLLIMPHFDDSAENRRRCELGCHLSGVAITQTQFDLTEEDRRTFGYKSCRSPWLIPIEAWPKLHGHPTEEQLHTLIENPKQYGFFRVLEREAYIYQHPISRQLVTKSRHRIMIHEGKCFLWMESKQGKAFLQHSGEQI